MAIRNLNQGTPTSDSQIPFGDTPNGQDRRASLSDVAEVLAPLLPNANGALVTQYAAPAATGFTVLINPPDDGDSMYLLLTPNAGYAAGTITLPAAALCQDGQELLATCTQSVTALTVAGNGSTINGAPTTLAANGFFRLRFDGVLHTWNRVG
jgi:hypothetical protein